MISIYEQLKEYKQAYTQTQKHAYKTTKTKHSPHYQHTNTHTHRRNKMQEEGDLNIMMNYNLMLLLQTCKINQFINSTIAATGQPTKNAYSDQRQVKYGKMTINF